MSKPLYLAANWKMHVGPGEARTFLREFLRIDQPRADRTVAFFPPAPSIEAVAGALEGREGYVVGAQNIYWEPKGAFTGELSVAIARSSGAGAALIGHSERRHVFGETDEETGRKVRAVLDGGLQAVLCVGEKLEEREAGQTGAVVERQLRAGLAGVESGADLIIAYEPVWAIGTGRNATPADANTVHAAIRGVLESLGLPSNTRILYGGSVKPDNAAALVAEEHVDGLLVGGASLEPESWGAICRV
jgi:triosephosphate isomerase